MFPFLPLQSFIVFNAFPYPRTPNLMLFAHLVKVHVHYSLCNTTVSPMITNIAVFSHGYSLSNIVTYPTIGT